MDNNEEKVELIKPNSKNKNKNSKYIEKYNKNKKFISPILLGLIGLVLCTNSDNIIILFCYIIGAFILGFGIYNIYSYIQIKNQLKISDDKKMNTGIISIGIGLLIIVLSSIIKTFLNLLIGIWLIILGLSKLNGISTLIQTDRKKANFNIIEAGIAILMALYTIFFQNVILTAVGIWMIIASAIELFTILK